MNSFEFQLEGKAFYFLLYWRKGAPDKIEVCVQRDGGDVIIQNEMTVDEFCRSIVAGYAAVQKAGADHE